MDGGEVMPFWGVGGRASASMPPACCAQFTSGDDRGAQVCCAEPPTYVVYLFQVIQPS